MTFINVSDNYIPKAELESNENKIPKAIAQHFPDVQGDNIDNNKEAKEKKLMDLKKKHLLKPRQDMKRKMKSLCQSLMKRSLSQLIKKRQT
ncbi:hypothetical protein [Streptococcus gordonii]|uniref:hypothetical protein n=1 Tax=Streptococcus gordonii TaxID=1302 RepID=UPI0007797B6E|nr:hypothetical protein [Streptococcus gordonii]MCY7136693.1 hypothetical protein [Streptococcus gordonii]